MMLVKVQCVCGQKYSFDVEPDKGRMPCRVACPLCGADGTALANEELARRLSAAPLPVPAGAGVQRVTPGAAPPPIPSAPPPTPAPPPIPPMPRVVSTARTTTTARPPAQKSQRKDDGWGTPESDLNKLGLYVVMIPSIVAALLSWGILPIEVPMMILCIIVAVCGLTGGVMNLLGRGPIIAGAAIGLVIGLGGYGVTYLWIHNRQSAYKVELILAFTIGALPGIGLQYLLQRLLRKRIRAAA